MYTYPFSKTLQEYVKDMADKAKALADRSCRGQGSKFIKLFIFSVANFERHSSRFRMSESDVSKRGAPSS